VKKVTYEAQRQDAGVCRGCFVGSLRVAADAEHGSGARGKSDEQLRAYEVGSHCLATTVACLQLAKVDVADANAPGCIQL
jgi:hypothetical protein